MPVLYELFALRAIQIYTRNIVNHALAKRLGHERVQTTMEIFSRLYPNKQAEVAMQLNSLTAKS